MHSSFKDNIWGVDLADMQSLSKYNKGIKYLLCAIDFFSKYAWVIPLKDKKGTSKPKNQIKYGLIKVVNFTINLLKIFGKKKNIEMYLTFNEGKSVVAERFIKILKNKFFKYMTTISKNVYFDVLDDIVNKYNNTIHRTIKMKPIDVTDDSYAKYNEESKKKNRQFKAGDDVKIYKYKNVFANGYATNWSEEIFVINKIKNTVPWTYAINDLNGEEIT